MAVLNILLWSLCAVWVVRTPIDLRSGHAPHLQLLLSAIYVSGCAFRSALPVYDIPRIVLVDSRFSSVLVGRTVATIAEVSFAAQWGLALHHMGTLVHSHIVQGMALTIVPLIVLAEGFSWRAVLTTAQVGHVAENSLWGITALLVVASLVLIGPHRFPQLYRPMVVWYAAGIAYVVFIFSFDVPMYWARWRIDRSLGRQYLSFAQGLLDVRQRRVISGRWEDWSTEVPWMSLYFTLGAWSSLSLVYASTVLGTGSR